MTDTPAPHPASSAPDLPPDAILLHIGPYKTGSTALQSALFQHRDELAAYGVAYPGKWRRLFSIGHSLLEWAPRGHEVPPPQRWDRFAARVRGMTDTRVCLSTEDFGRIQRPEKIAKIVADLGPERLHVVAVARAYHRLLPSHWQERVKSHQTVTYEEFLRQVLDEDKGDRAFHSSHDIEWMTSMWRPHLPPERFTIIVTDDSDRGLLTRTFEQLLGLPAGLLTLDDNANASLSYQATEMLRRVNQEFEAHGWDDPTYTRFVQRGLVQALQACGRSPAESGVGAFPEWAVDMLRRRSEERVTALLESGVNVIGDPERLLPPADLARVPELPPTEVVGADTAARAVAGVLEVALTEPDPAPDPAPGPAGGPDRGQDQPPPAQAPRRGPTLDEVGGRDLARALAARVRRRLRRHGERA